MALTREYKANDTRTGTAYAAAYIRIRTATFDHLNRLTMTIDWWENEAWAKSGQKVPWRTEVLIMPNFDQSGANPKTQAYNWLKTQSEFSNCGDAD